jgi:hypothetical protein
MESGVCSPTARALAAAFAVFCLGQGGESTVQRRPRRDAKFREGPVQVTADGPGPGRPTA